MSSEKASRAMAAEIEFENDQDFWRSDETPEQRWKRMRQWIGDHLAVPCSA